MTTIEHALLGVNLAFATGMHRRFGPSVVVLSGLAAIAPDWDGLPMLIDMARFESGHRVWGHNVFACLILAFALGSIDWRFKFSDRVVQSIWWMLTAETSPPSVDSTATRLPARTKHANWLTWITVAFLAALTQIPADAVVSGGQGLSDWPLQPLWPFSKLEFVYPMIPWGNLGVTIIFSVAMIAQAKWLQFLQSIAIISLTSVSAYLIIWKTVFG